MWAAAAWAYVAAWASLSFLQTSGDIEMTAWRMVLVEPTRFKSTVTQTSRTLVRTLCGMACVENSWCSLWCFTVPNQCQLTSLIVSASYIPTEPTGALICYTRMKTDLVFGVPFASSPSKSTLPLREAKNLVDGYYAHDIDDCAYAVYEAPDGAWFQFDLSSVFSVAEVVLRAQPDGDAGQYFRDIEVRVAVSPAPSPGVFSPFTLLGTFEGPGVENETVVLRPAEPLMARYVSIQRMSSGDLQIAHLEIR